MNDLTRGKGLYLQVNGPLACDTGYDDRDYVDTSQPNHTFAVGEQYSFPPVELTAFNTSAAKDDLAFTPNGAPPGFLINPSNGFIQLAGTVTE